MSDIEYITPAAGRIPTDLMLDALGVNVIYKRITNGFHFHVFLNDECKAMRIVEKIVQRMLREHNSYGVPWVTTSLEVVRQEDPRYTFGTSIEWRFSYQ